jgi:REP element-mobilizing transposase RayT
MFIARRRHQPRTLATFASLLLLSARSTNLTLDRAERSYLMANTFSQIYIQTVFAVNGRLSLITSDFKEELHKYITGIVRKQGQKLIRINGMPDHLHILIGLKPAMALANLVTDIKSDSSEWVNKKKLARAKFAWQEGYGAFSYGHSQLDTIVRYVMNQEKHHQRRSFRDEYLTLLRKFEIEFKEEFVFEFYS